MRSNVPEYELITPQNFQEALRLLDSEPGTWRPLAGGTDLMVLFEAGKLPYKKLLNLWGMPELNGVEVTGQHMTMGALTTYTQVRRNAVLSREFPMLAEAAAVTGGIATQNRGTLGGNIVNASPAADSPPALMVYDAELNLVSLSGSRWVPYSHFHTGYKQMDLRPNELLRRIRLPRRRVNWREFYRKVGTRKAQAIAKVCFAGAMQVEAGVVQHVRIALGSVAPVVLRCARTEAVLRGRRLDGEAIRTALEALAREIAPIDDVRSNALYRLRVAQNVLEEFLIANSAREELPPGEVR